MSRRRETSSQPRYIRSAALRAFDAAAATTGTNARLLLNRRGLDLAGSEDENTFIPLSAYLELLVDAALVTNQPDFGMRVAASEDVPDFGPVSLLLREAENVEAALCTMRAYMPLHSNGVEIAIEKRFEDPFIAIRVHASGTEQTFQASQYWLTSIFLTLRWLIGQQFSPLLVYLPHSRLGSVTINRVLRCPVTRDAGMTGILLTRSMFDQSLASSPRFLRDEAVRRLAQAIPLPPADLATTLSVIIRRRLSNGSCRSQDVCRELGLNRRTLSRRLQSDALSFSALIQTVRKEVVRSRLSYGNCSLAELVQITGFESHSAFCRWFMTNFGCTMTQMKDRRVDRNLLEEATD